MIDNIELSKKSILHSSKNNNKEHIKPHKAGTLKDCPSFKSMFSQGQILENNIKNLTKKIIHRENISQRRPKPNEIKKKANQRSEFYGGKNFEATIKLSNSNFDNISDIKSEYTKNSNLEFFINNNEKNKEYKLKDNTIFINI